MQHFSNIVLDITNHCNARCRFCYNRWESLREQCMEKELFQHIVEAFTPLVEEYMVLSCNFEPTLHPQFIEFMEFLPAKFKEKFFFTSNLARQLTEEDWHRLAAANLNFINVSFLTLNRDLYRRLIRTPDSFYYDNIQMMSRVFAQYPDAPKIRFVTTILKDNHAELLEMAEKGRELIPTAFHEFRTPYASNCDRALAWLKTQTLPPDQLEETAAKLSHLGPHIRMYVDPNTHEDIQKAQPGSGTWFYRWKDTSGGLELPLHAFRPTRGRIQADGLAVFYGLPWVFDLKRGDIEGAIQEVFREMYGDKQ